MKQRSKTITLGITNIPMLNGEIVMGISHAAFYCRTYQSRIRYNLNVTYYFLFYVVLNVLPKLKQTSRYTYEAALDLGASPLYAFFKVVFPDILPGVISGFLLAFTMSLDDFVITHFTKGPGIDTLSTKIYSEVRKGIKPEMYALSTLLFGTVLILLLLVNMEPDTTAKSSKTSRRFSHFLQKKPVRIFLRRIVPAVMVLVIIAGGFFYGSKETITGDNQVIVYNWGEYLDPETITLFELCRPALFMKNLRQTRSCIQRCSPVPLPMMSSALLPIT